MPSVEHLIIGLTLITSIGLALAFGLFVWRKFQESRELDEELALKATVSHKAAMSELALSSAAEPVPRDEDQLTDSGVFAIHELLDKLIQNGELDSAEIWAANMLRSNPNHTEVALKLASIYHQRQQRADFFSVLSRHVISRQDDIATGEWHNLERMMSDFSSHAGLDGLSGGHTASA